MIHLLVNLWYVPALALVSSVLYMAWKAKGGSLLFRVKPTDDATTQIMKVIFGMGWAYGSTIVSICVCAISALWLIVALIGVAVGS